MYSCYTKISPQSAEELEDVRVVVEHRALAHVGLEVRLGALVDALVEVALSRIQLELVGAYRELGEL